MKPDFRKDIDVEIYSLKKSVFSQLFQVSFHIGCHTEMLTMQYARYIEVNNYKSGFMELVIMRKFKQSLGYAFDGIRYAFKSQRNFRIQVFMGGIALLLAIFFRISAGEMIALSFAIAFVLFAELINTAIESVLDLTIKEYNQMVMIAKDVAAAAVTITVANSIIIGIIIFLPKIINVLK